MNIFLFWQLPSWICIALALTTTTGCANKIEKTVLLSSTAPGSGAQSKNAECRTSEFAFRYSADFKLSVADHGALIRLLPRSQSAYWEDAIIIRKRNKKTEECDLPQNSQPENRDRRNIAGQRAYAYSSEDAAMNRYIRTKGYMIEHGDYCWDFQIVRKGKPYRKFDLPENELKRLDAQSDRDSKAANAAFKLILDSFVFLRPQ